MKRHEIQVLRRSGVTIRRIAEQAEVSPSTIKRIVREPAIEADSAIALARENEVPILVFSIHNPGGFAEVVFGEGTYTIIN